MLVIMVLESIVAPSSAAPYLPAWLKAGLYAVLPSPKLFSETHFLTITEASAEEHSAPASSDCAGLRIGLGLGVLSIGRMAV